LRANVQEREAASLVKEAATAGGSDVVNIRSISPSEYQGPDREPAPKSHSELRLFSDYRRMSDCDFSWVPLFLHQTKYGCAGFTAIRNRTKISPLPFSKGSSALPIKVPGRWIFTPPRFISSDLIASPGTSLVTQQIADANRTLSKHRLSL
jgi:hypothetical protein